MLTCFGINYDAIETSFEKLHALPACASAASQY